MKPDIQLAIDCIKKELIEDGCGIGKITVVNKEDVTGTKQSILLFFTDERTNKTHYFEHEYVDQSCGISGDDWNGHCYYPIGDDIYLSFEFFM